MTTRAIHHYTDVNGELLWSSSLFGVNATNETKVTLDGGNLTLVKGGSWSINYQKRVIDAAMWVNEVVNESVIEERAGSSGFLPAPSMLIVIVSFALAAINRRNGIFEH